MDPGVVDGEDGTGEHPQAQEPEEAEDDDGDEADDSQQREERLTGGEKRRVEEHDNADEDEGRAADKREGHTATASRVLNCGQGGHIVMVPQVTSTGNDPDGAWHPRGEAPGQP